jgi:type I restriction enzyme S subunit
LKSVYIPLAPRTEQDRIVAAIEQHLSDIDAGVAALKRILANLKRYRASVLKAACEGRLVPTEAELARKEGRDYEPADVLLRRMLQERRERWEADQLAKMKAKGQVPRDERWKAKYEEPKGLEASELPELPEGWVWAGLGQLTSLITSGSRGWGDRYAAVGPLFIRAQDIKTDRLVLENVARVDLSGAEEGTRTRVRMGDLLVTITGANVTKTASVVMDLEEAYVSQHVGLVRPLLPESAAFLHAWIVSPAQGRRQLERVAYGAGKPGLNLDNLRELSIALPPLPEQHRIVAEVDRLLSVADETEHAVRAQLARAERLRQAVLKNAFEGKLVPQDPQDEPASVLLERIRSGHAAAEPATSGSAKTSRKGRAKVLRQAVKGEMNDG